MPRMSQRRLAAILSLDVVGYSRLMQVSARSVLSTLNALYRDLVTPIVQMNHGRVVKLLGDGVLIEFSSAGQALNAAIAIQMRLREPANPYQTPERIFLRAGLHVGDVTIEAGDVFGDAVNIATRIQAKAEPGGVLASKMLCDLAGTDFSHQLRGEGLHSFKGIHFPIEVLSADFTDVEVLRSRKAFAKSQDIQYCKTKDNVSLAWNSVGTGTPIVKAPNWIGHLELDWRNPGMAPIITSLAAHHRLIRFDARLNGLSDWDSEKFGFDRFVDDLERVFDAAQIERAPILAFSQGSAVALTFAARHPDRVSAIVMIGGFPLGLVRRMSEKNAKRARAMQQMMMTGWDDDYPSLRDLMAQIIVPGASEEDRRQYAEDMKHMISPENMGRYRHVIDNLDVRDLLPQVQAPCLICHARHDRMQPFEQGLLLAKGLPNARFVAYESANHLMPENDPEWPRLERDTRAFFAAHA